ncbi:hypothetical protein CHLRE_03g174600v5 [Chlamydomonas reinhardtii]|uniref:PHD-type domain-containing protein n=1 Tax=Chlamydomonas reinhardtii TaxID=3055 RepID=A0A2K3DXA7_CHLRE|nr:uncharacterized protein CHLRE_03g174600v5 [Chlamydomonas reinhardtii]PNW85170.1 hypothetical protein CHLRE_03g174600v5 [Chlamydomonas reinhardtii]
MASIEPHAKRQRKEPSWRAEFVDPDQVKDGTLIADEDPTAQQLVALQQLGQKQGQGQGQQHKRGSTGPASSASSDEGSDPGTSEEPPRVLDVRPLDANKVEVVVERDGRRYRGVMERKELPHSVGVPVPITPEELESITAMVAHGENGTSLCGLCNTKLECTPVRGMSADKVGKYVKVRITSNWTARVHMQCAVWCPEVVEDPFHPGYLHHMGPAVRRGRQLRCHVCKNRGATVGCFQEGCPSVYHLTCAVKAGCAFNEETQEVWCPAHTH